MALRSMKTSLYALVLAVTPLGCTTETVALFEDAGATLMDTQPRPQSIADAETSPDAGSVDADPPDVEASIDAEPDAGPTDTGVPPVLRCPTTIVPTIFRDEFVAGARHLEAAAGPDRAWTLTDTSPGGPRLSTYRHASGQPPESVQFSFVSQAERGRSQLAARGDDAVVVISTTDDPAGQLLRIREQTDRGGALLLEQLIEPGFALEDAAVTRTAYVVALSSTVSSPYLFRATRGSTGGWRQRAMSPPGTQLRSMHLVGLGDIWWYAGDEISETFSPDLRLLRGTTQVANRLPLLCFSLGVPGEIHDVAAADDIYFWQIYSCRGRPSLSATSFSVAATNYDFALNSRPRAPARIAFDGLTMGIVDWPALATYPTLRFRDPRDTTERGAATLELTPPEAGAVPTRLEMAASISQDQRRAQYVVLTVFRRPDDSEQVTTAIFEGCRLE